MSGEEWRSIPGWPEYEASDEGSIRTIGGHVRSVTEGEFGHLSLVLYHADGSLEKQWVHRLVCAAFHGPAPAEGLHAAHRNGISSDNRKDNLRWATPAENEADKKLHGTDNGRARNGMAKLTEADVEQILLVVPTLPRSSGGIRFKKGAIPALAARYGVSAACISQIAHGRRWASASS